ncbi:hypothetical protein MKQ70_06945 [Chitinophaga sedimenti]|nr:hypothetical protein [Chitinophaga sedimenti]MCK7554751.1 hypothetical protein [Chitinophaga sedimenti]
MAKVDSPETAYHDKSAIGNRVEATLHGHTVIRMDNGLKVRRQRLSPGSG